MSVNTVLLLKLHLTHAPNAMQAALKQEKEHFEDIIAALRAEGEQRVAAVSNKLHGAQAVASLALSKRSELEARVGALEVSWTAVNPERLTSYKGVISHVL